MKTLKEHCTESIIGNNSTVAIVQWLCRSPDLRYQAGPFYPLFSTPTECRSFAVASLASKPPFRSTVLAQKFVEGGGDIL